MKAHYCLVTQNLVMAVMLLRVTLISTVPQFCSGHTADDGIARLQVLLGKPDLRKHRDWHAGYHSTSVNLACNLTGLTAHMFGMKHQWSKQSNTRDLRQHLGRSQRHICCFPDHIQCLQHFGAWSSCLCVLLFSSWRIWTFKMSLLPQNLQIASLAVNLSRNEHLPYTRHRTPSDFLLSVFGLGLNCFSLYQFLCNPPISFFI